MSYGVYQPWLQQMLPFPGTVTQAIMEFDPGLAVMWNKKLHRFEIYDRNAPGGPKWQHVLRVQEPNGNFRPLDGRVLETLRRARGRRVEDILDEFDKNADAREQAEARERRILAAAMADDLKYIGKTITPTVESRNRSREAIRREAGL